MAADGVRRWTLVGERVKLGRDASNQLLMSVENRVLRGDRLAVGESVEVVAVEDVRRVVERLWKDCPHAGRWSNPAWHDALDAVTEALGLEDDTSTKGEQGGG